MQETSAEHSWLRDRYVEDYLIQGFRETPVAMTRRDYVGEQRIIRACMIEWHLHAFVYWADGKIDPNPWEQPPPPHVAAMLFPVHAADRRLEAIRRRAKGFQEAETIAAMDRNLLVEEYGLHRRNGPVTPLLSLFAAMYHRSQLHPAIDDLSEVFNNELERMEGAESLAIDATWLYPLGASGLGTGCPFRAQFLDADRQCFLHVVVHSSSRNRAFRKYMIPLLVPAGLLRPFHFIPRKAKAPLYGEFLLSRFPDSIVILTDCLELAVQNQAILSTLDLGDIVWASWYGGRDRIEQTDWAMLKGRYVYYLLFGHSGISDDDHFRTATCINDRLAGVVAGPCRFVSLIHQTPDFPRDSWVQYRIPVIFSSHIDMTRTSHKQRLPSGSTPTLGDFVQKHSAMLAERRTMFISPMVYERTLTVLYGNNSDALTWFALSMAFFASQGRMFLSRWGTGKAMHILYIHSTTERGNTSILERLHILLASLARGDVGMTDSFGSTMNGSCFFEEGRIQFMHFPEIPRNDTPNDKKYPTTGTFRWMNVEDQFDIDKMPFEEFQRLLLSAMDESFSGKRGTVFFDAIPSSIYRGSERYDVRFNRLVRDITARGHAVVLVLPDTMKPSGALGVYQKVDGPDSVIRVNRMGTDSGNRLLVDIRILDGYRVMDPKSYGGNASLDRYGDRPGWRLVRTQIPPSRLLPIVAQLWVERGFSVKATAERLGYSVKWVDVQRKRIRDAAERRRAGKGDEEEKGMGLVLDRIGDPGIDFILRGRRAKPNTEFVP